MDNTYYILTLGCNLKALRNYACTILTGRHSNGLKIPQYV